MKRILTTVFGILCLSAAVMASVVDMSYIEPDASCVAWGTSKAEIYNGAIRINDASLIGKKVTAVKFVWHTGATAANCKVFLASELKNVSNIAVGDLAEEPFDAPTADSLAVVTLSTPWTIDRADFYAGYSLRISSLALNENSYPLVFAPCEDADACYVSTSRTFKKWTTPAQLAGYGLTVTLVLDGEFEANAAGVVSVSDVVCTPAEAGECTVSVANHGLEPISNISYTYTVDDKSVSGTYEFDPPLSSELYGMKGDLRFNIPAISDHGEYAGTFTIDKVNGVANTDPAAAGSNMVGVAGQMAVRRVVMEEFTGTWCAWCVRGIVAMNLLNKQLQDSFIALAYHVGDPMQTATSYPVSVTGFPSASIERGAACDPYYGSTSDTPLGILNQINARLALTVPANVSVTASYNADQTAIDIDASAYFFKALQENPYRLEYVVTADELSGPVDSLGWWQNNAYSRYPASALPGGEEFCSPADSYVQIPFNDVVLTYSPFSGEAGSLPASVEFGQTYDHSYSFDITDIKESVVNGGVADRSLIQNPDRVYVTVLLLDSTTGRIVNAAKCKVTGAAAVKDVLTERTLESVDYYDLSGRLIKGTPSAGLVIERKRYTDGTQSTTKRIIR